MSARTVGRLIVLEGIDGSGTTTQLARLGQTLSARNLACVCTREPTPGPVGRLIRSALSHELESDGVPVALDFRSMALLFAADRADHNERVIRPALSAGKLVLSDRYTLSSLLYQSLTAPSGVDCLQWLVAINSSAEVPDLVIVLDVDADVAAERRARRGGAPELFEQDLLQRRLAEGYRNASSVLQGQRVVVLDGNRSPELVEREIQEQVDRLLNER
ncbi:MAG TPA: dTMP kinase [Polyangiaceae bacterium]|nr:dTMP kinase [Polyangiaceae bacterium]